MDKLIEQNITGVALDTLDTIDTAKLKGNLRLKIKFLQVLHSREVNGNVMLVCDQLKIPRSRIYNFREEKTPYFDKEFMELWDQVVEDCDWRFVGEIELGFRKLVLGGNSSAIIHAIKKVNPKKWGDQPVTSQQFNQFNFYSFKEEEKEQFNQTFDKWFEERYGPKKIEGEQSLDKHLTSV